ncbi:hypothetical protein Tco_0768298 [Tanacetum coccineum]
MNGNRQMVPVDYFFNNDLKYLQGGISTLTYTTSTTYTKAAQYDRQGIEDMVPNIWSHVKVTYDKYELWGISHWIKQRKTFYAYARSLESSHDVYSTKHIWIVTQVEVMRKHGLTNLSDDDVFRLLLLANKFHTEAVVYSKESRRFSTRSRKLPEEDQRPTRNTQTVIKKDPTLHIKTHKIHLFDNQGRNKLMRSDELYKFSDGTLTRLQTSLDDITKNIRMEYLPQRRWKFIEEKKRAHITIKAIDKQLKERRMVRSFEKFIGGRHYGTDLRLLQRTI